MNFSYLAGLIDGQGTLSFMSEARRNGGVMHRPFLSIASTNEDLMLAVQDFLGSGTIYNNRPETSTNAATFFFRIHGPALLPILHSIEPHLILKQPQARELIAWIERRGIERTRPYQDVDHKHVAKVKYMNRKGPRR